MDDVNNQSNNVIKIAYLYEDLMNTYGDSGDVKILSYLLKQKHYDVQVDNISIETKNFNAFNYDFLFFGGGQDLEQTVVASDFQRFRETINKYIQNNGVFLGICGGYQLLGSYYKTSDGTVIKGLNILPFHTTFNPKYRMVGNTEYICRFGRVYSFENHSGCTYFDNKKILKPFGKMIKGHGNNPEYHTEGMQYKNTIGCYSHGPLLKNLNVANGILQMVLNQHNNKKYIK